MKRLFAALALSILSSAHANSSPGAVGSNWPSLIDALLSLGVSQVGNFDVSRFQAQASAIVWKPIAGAPGLTESGARQSAYYVCGETAIHVSDQLSPVARSSLAQLELHELLGALCYDDRNYAMSTALSVLARMENSVEREKLLAAYARAPYFQGVRLAGATSVSGGGDLESLFVKDQVLAEIMGNSGNQNSATVDFLISYPAIDFEPVRGVSEVYVKYDYTFASKQETFQIMVPIRRWQAGETARATLVRETARKVKAVFPAYKGTQTRTFVPSACRAMGKNISVTYPATEDVNMLQIQEARGALSLGCNPIAIAASIGITAPAIAVSDEPKPSGFYYFTCSALVDGRLVARQNLSTQAGTGVLASWFSRAIAGGDNLEISLGVDRSGAPIATYFVYSAPGGRHLAPVIVNAGATMPVQAQTQIGGRSVHVSCERVN